MNIKKFKQIIKENITQLNSNKRRRVLENLSVLNEQYSPTIVGTPPEGVNINSAGGVFVNMIGSPIQNGVNAPYQTGVGTVVEGGNTCNGLTPFLGLGDTSVTVGGTYITNPNYFQIGMEQTPDVGIGLVAYPVSTTGPFTNPGLDESTPSGFCADPSNPLRKYQRLSPLTMFSDNYGPLFAIYQGLEVQVTGYTTFQEVISSFESQGINFNGNYTGITLSMSQTTGPITCWCALGGVPGCTDPSALNYNPEATYGLNTGAGFGGNYACASCDDPLLQTGDGQELLNMLCDGVNYLGEPMDICGQPNPPLFCECCTRHKCSPSGQCVEDPDGPFTSLTQCENSGCEPDPESATCEDFELQTPAGQAVICNACSQGNIPPQLAQLCDCCPDYGGDDTDGGVGVNTDNPGFTMGMPSPPDQGPVDAPIGKDKASRKKGPAKPPLPTKLVNRPINEQVERMKKLAGLKKKK